MIYTAQKNVDPGVLLDADRVQHIARIQVLASTSESLAHQRYDLTVKVFFAEAEPA